MSVKNRVAKLERQAAPKEHVIGLAQDGLVHIGDDRMTEEEFYKRYGSTAIIIRIAYDDL